MFEWLNIYECVTGSAGVTGQKYFYEIAYTMRSSVFKTLNWSNRMTVGSCEYILTILESLLQFTAFLFQFRLVLSLTMSQILESDVVQSPKYIILDTDMGTDDMWALIMLLKTEKHFNHIKLLAITCVHGNTSIDNVINNTFAVLDIMKRTDVGHAPYSNLRFGNFFFNFLSISS